MKLAENTSFEYNGTVYIIKSKIDDGGNAVVWLADVAEESNTYAIKVLNENSRRESKKLERFKNECEFCKKNTHKNIIKIYDYLADEDKAFCIMPYYQSNLRRIIENENNPFVLLEYIIELCEAIQFIHQQGIIHRDLKPENILVDNGILVLADFGIAHFEDSTKTKHRDWLGNRRYAAPEQLATDELTTACDIYALGRIINEVFTKKNPAGESITKISENHPLLSSLDRLVQKCRMQSPEQRPSIDDILIELRLLYHELKENLDDIQDVLYPLEDFGYDKEKTIAIIALASTDILIAQNLFERLPDEKLEELNTIYHRNILYNAETWVQNLHFQVKVLDYCRLKFRYEANAYNNNQTYVPLNLEDAKDASLYNELNLMLESHKIPNKYRGITADIKKMFCSCCNYHCEELLSYIRELAQKESPLVKAPIMHIVYVLRNTLEYEDIKEIDLLDNITICWESRPSPESEENQVYLMQETNELEVLISLKEKYNVVYDKINHKEHYVRFKNKEDYIRFKDYALELSKPYYVFEGDVLKIIRIRREYCGIIELEPLDSFDITSTLAKILGMRTDY